MTTNHESESNIDLNPGTFSLPLVATQSSEPPEGPHGERQGACRSQWTSGDDIISEGEHSAGQQNTDDFPMIVWLRGDEPWFDQFSMDAEAVMKALGIKRSRLTQIAGRELRVGRVRVDRYVRPVFRPKDVDHYLHLTRATASHQRSADLINAAQSALKQQIVRFQDTLQTLNENLVAQMGSGIRSVIYEMSTDTTNQLSVKLDAMELEVVNRISVLTQETMVKQLGILSGKFDQTFATALAAIDEIRKTNAAINEALNGTLKDELNEAINVTVSETISRTQSDFASEVVSNFSTFQHQILAIDERIKTSEKTILQTMTAILSDLAQLKKPMKFVKTTDLSHRESLQFSATKARRSLARQRAAPNRRRIKRSPV